MTPTEYLDAAKTKTGIASDYELAKRLETAQTVLTSIRKGRRPLTPYLCAKIALALDLDPVAVIADVEGQTDKDEKRRAFWKSLIPSPAKKAPARAMAETKTIARKVTKAPVTVLSRSIETS